MFAIRSHTLKALGLAAAVAATSGQTLAGPPRSSHGGSHGNSHGSFHGSSHGKPHGGVHGGSHGTADTPRGVKVRQGNSSIAREADWLIQRHQIAGGGNQGPPLARGSKKGIEAPVAHQWDTRLQRAIR